ncbi:MAG TPA: elongator complex protein 3 [Anaerolineales bacterium]|nr:elongator complex protein 3 [Anaerolineales bacterium]
MDRRQAWLEARRYPEQELRLARRVLEDVQAGIDVADALRRHPLPNGGFLGKHVLVRALRQGVVDASMGDLLRRIRMKPVRTLSGVTTVTVLTKPYPCPGRCVFCPTDARMPKSYLPDEPGARRALEHAFDPYDQTRSRLEALEAIGHPTAKVELLILGGTWSAYRRDYQAWFVRRCLDALNGFDSASLAEAQSANARASRRNVGLVIETRPDHIDADEIAHLRRLGVTKVQIGAQSLDDRILALNERGHTVADLRRAAAWLRSAGFKIVLHWMPNLLGATPESDREDFARLWADQELRPDEIKIYPCQLLRNAELYDHWLRGDYHPYTTETLVDLLADIKPTIPPYCRVNRVIRDIPSTNVVEGNRRTSLRLDAQRELARRGQRCHCIRCREVRGSSIELGRLRMHVDTFRAAGGLEHFVSLVTDDDRLAAYLRLWLPGDGSPDPGLPDIEGSARVRELHVYGQSLEFGDASGGAAQHSGLGAALMARAEELARGAGLARVAVIAALGTRLYYERLGYRLGETYMVRELDRA